MVYRNSNYFRFTMRNKYFKTGIHIVFIGYFLLAILVIDRAFGITGLYPNINDTSNAQKINNIFDSVFAIFTTFSILTATFVGLWYLRKLNYLKSVPKNQDLPYNFFNLFDVIGFLGLFSVFFYGIIHPLLEKDMQFKLVYWVLNLIPESYLKAMYVESGEFIQKNFHLQFIPDLKKLATVFIVVFTSPFYFYSINQSFRKSKKAST